MLNHFEHKIEIMLWILPFIWFYDKVPLSGDEITVVQYSQEAPVYNMTHGADTVDVPTDLYTILF